jgi:hypothetical protein
MASSIINIVRTNNEQNRNRPLERTFVCSYCPNVYVRIGPYFEHMQTVHECPCGASVPSLSDHTCELPSAQTGGSSLALEPLELGVFRVVREAHNAAIVNFKVDFTEAIKTFEDAFEFVYPSLEHLLAQLVLKRNGIKVSFNIDATLEKVNDDTTINRKIICPYATIINTKFIRSRIDTSFHYLVLSLSLYQEGESGWKLTNVNSMEIQIVSYKPDLRRGKGFVQLPKEIRRCKVLNIVSKTPNCFMLHIVAGLYRHEIVLPDAPNTHPSNLTTNQKKRLKRKLERECSYTHILDRIKRESLINFKGYMGAVELESIVSFEMSNNISVNVFEFKDDSLFPIYESEIVSDRRVNLLFLQNPDSSNGHYCLIQNLGSFAMRKNHGAMQACFYCFQRHRDGSSRHLNVCLKTNPKRIKIPKEMGAAFDQFHMYLPINFKIFYKILYGPMPSSADIGPLKYTTKDGNEGVVGFAIAVFDCDHDVIFRTSYVGLAGIRVCQNRTDT